MGYVEISMSGSKKGAAPRFYPYLRPSAGEIFFVQKLQDSSAADVQLLAAGFWI
jgi:hypothetical protein